MADLQTPSALPAEIRREDYRPPDWLVPDIELDFHLDAARTAVRARLTIVREGQHDRPVRLDGEALQLREVSKDGEPLSEGAWYFEDEQLVIPVDEDETVIETLVELSPEANTQLMGLYASGGIEPHQLGIGLR